MEIISYVMGPFETNTYFLKEGNEVLIIDPAGKTDKVIELLNEEKPLAVILTHGHFDHIKAVDGLYKRYGMPVYIHEDDLVLARDKNQGEMYNMYNHISCPVEYLKEGKMNIGPFTFEVIFTPGHTEGSVLYKFNDVIFTGDTLFKGSVGRTDLKGGNESKLMASLRVFNEMDKKTIIYPGHGDSSNLYEEYINNPFLH